ncbi:MAG: restriction endonuclease subunit S [Anaerolineaceae bacterium]|nr:restriction endonuclease subunit S [Anaerolineaceae bacterium]
MNKWSLYSTKDLIAQNKLVINDGYRAKNIELSKTGLPFLRAGNLNENDFNFDKADFFPISDLHKVGIKKSKPGDVILTTKGTVGRFAFVRDDTEPVVYAPQISFWRVLDKNTIEPRFLYYWILGKEFEIQCNQVKGNTDMADYVSLADQRQMQITLPPLPTQRRVAEILGRLDDKIETNRRINRTLEAMAQALFKHHFVDFGPYQDGPFVESELGLIRRVGGNSVCKGYSHQCNGLSYGRVITDLVDEGKPNLYISINISKDRL